ncbi:MAG: malonyl-CoA/methylmalonyl-CoA synthetase [Cocleimonas sp.]
MLLPILQNSLKGNFMKNVLYDDLFGKYSGKSTPFLILESDEIITHEKFLELASRIANTFTQIGLKVGDRVAVQVHKSPEALALYAACVQAGLIFLPLNTAYTVDELSYFIENSGAALLVCDGSNENNLSVMANSFGTIIETLDIDGSGTLMEKANTLSSSFTTIERGLDDLVVFLYTSGTTGRSKGAMLTQGNLLSNAHVLAKEWRFTADDVLLHALPIFHIHGLFVASNVILASGGSMIFLTGFNLNKVIEYLPQATTMMGVPTFYTRLLGDPRLAKTLVQHMRLFVSGSAPLLAETHIQFEDRTGHRILERYGMTETNMNTSNPYDGDRRAGTVGYPLSGIEVKITDTKSGENLPTGETGAIEVRGPNVFKGYWQMPKKTAAELRNNGFFITGDLGKIDSEGYLHIVGRDKDLIISGGYNIYPKEIELILDEQLGVLESAVIGVPHPDFGETVLGIVIPEPGYSPNLENIMITIKQSIARFKHPKKIIILDELPRNTMGKVQKNLLRDRYQSMFNG